MLDSKNKTRSVWGASPAGTTHAFKETPGTKEFFIKVLKRRNEYEIPWLFDLIPFSSMKEKQVLELGCGAGYDAYELCRNSAEYTGIDITPQNIIRTKKHLSYFGFEPEIVEADVENLPFSDESFDIVYSNGVLHHTPDIMKSFQETFRVLRKDGQFWVILYHRDSIFYWISLFLVDYIMHLGFLKGSFSERVAKIEFTTSKELPIVNVYSKIKIKEMLKNAGFEVKHIWVRKLLPEDLPNVPLIRRFWRRIPQNWLNAIGCCFGWYVIAQARKGV